jgi:hypothetical protein
MAVGGGNVSPQASPLRPFCRIGVGPLNTGEWLGAAADGDERR